MAKTLVRILFAISLFIYSTSTALAATYYVAGDTGNDTTGNGSSGTPWQTIQRAADTMVAGDTAFIKGNLSYTGSNNCSFGSPRVVCQPRSGDSSNYITYTAWPDTGTPTIYLPGAGAGFDLNSKAYIIVEKMKFSYGTDAAATGVFVILSTSPNIIETIF
jgi:hypothetical protein